MNNKQRNTNNINNNNNDNNNKKNVSFSMPRTEFVYVCVKVLEEAAHHFSLACCWKERQICWDLVCVCVCVCVGGLVYVYWGGWCMCVGGDVLNNWCMCLVVYLLLCFVGDVGVVVDLLLC